VGNCPFLGFFAHVSSSSLAFGFVVVFASSGRRDWRMGWFGLDRLLVGA